MSQIKSVLVTGGAGYIGSIAVRFLLDAGYSVTVLDNLSTGFRDMVDPRANFVLGDIRDSVVLERIFKDSTTSPIDCVLHFAAKIIVPESIELPFEYYDNNFVGGLRLLNAAVEANVKKFVFSSTAAVYGPVTDAPVLETIDCHPQNPYGSSKFFFENLLQDVRKAKGLDFVILRYFNAAGASIRYPLGSKNPRATHLIKMATDVALGRRARLSVFGTDYPTVDGTGVRDYIHVDDLVDIHLAAIRYLGTHSCGEIINCGYGNGYSVLQVVEMFSKLVGHSLPLENCGRRPGDMAHVVANVEKLHRLFQWQPTNADLNKICKSSLLWESQKK